MCEWDSVVGLHTASVWKWRGAERRVAFIVAIQRHYKAVDALAMHPDTYVCLPKCMCRSVLLMCTSVTEPVRPLVTSVLGHFGPPKRTEMTMDRSDQGPNWPYPNQAVLQYFADIRHHFVMALFNINYRPIRIFLLIGHYITMVASRKISGNFRNRFTVAFNFKTFFKQYARAHETKDLRHINNKHSALKLIFTQQ